MTDSNPLQVTWESAPGVEVVHATGEIDLATCEQLKVRLDMALSALKATGILIVDLQGVTFFGASGLSVLVELYRACSAARVSFKVVANGTSVLRPLQLMGTGRLFPVYPSVAEATQH